RVPAPAQARARFHWAETQPGSAPDKVTARRWSFDRLPETMNGIGRRAPDDTGPHDVEADIERGKDRPENETENERQPVHEHLGIPRRRNQKRQWSEKQESAGKEWRQFGGQIEADKSERRGSRHVDGRKTVAECDPVLGGNRRQQTQ